MQGKRLIDTFDWGKWKVYHASVTYVIIFVRLQKCELFVSVDFDMVNVSVNFLGVYAKGRRWGRGGDQDKTHVVCSFVVGYPLIEGRTGTGAVYFTSCLC